MSHQVIYVVMRVMWQSEPALSSRAVCKGECDERHGTLGGMGQASTPGAGFTAGARRMDERYRKRFGESDTSWLSRSMRRASGAEWC